MLWLDLLPVSLCHLIRSTSCARSGRLDPPPHPVRRILLEEVEPTEWNGILIVSVRRYVWRVRRWKWLKDASGVFSLVRTRLACFDWLDLVWRFLWLWHYLPRLRRGVGNLPRPALFPSETHTKIQPTTTSCVSLFRHHHHSDFFYFLFWLKFYRFWVSFFQANKRTPS